MILLCSVGLELLTDLLGTLSMQSINKLFDILVQHEKKFHTSFNFIPSENIISPVSRIAFFSDGFSRYFFDEKEVFGRWSFQGGSIVGQIQKQILVPLFQKIAKAAYVNLHPISGLSGMTLALAAFGGKAGNRIISVPVPYGGHPDTRYVAEKLGFVVHDLPFTDWATVDIKALAFLVEKEKPALIYFDHATVLYPLDLKTVIVTIRQASVEPIHVHVDSSHVNGLIWGGQLPNPLECGADTYGGSTHKTFPGPHKAVLFTNDATIFERLTLTAVNMISHHHMASVIALTITLLEFDECGGAQYAAQIIKNASEFAHNLAKHGFDVQGKKDNYTASHQVWIDAPKGFNAHDAGSILFDAGLIVNPYNPLPSLNGPGIRMGVNESTRLGLKEVDMATLADYFQKIILERQDVKQVSKQVADFRNEFKPEYCYDEETFHSLLAKFSSALQDEIGEQKTDVTKLLYS